MLYDKAVGYDRTVERTVLHQGRILAQGSPLEIQENRQVREIYLGAGHGRAA